ncbi:ATP-dependent Clp protease ATP-binding subunit [bacterium]|nr:MAG: ATP-dependent Clp protease ATP-binding subunit [bacterium]
MPIDISNKYSTDFLQTLEKAFELTYFQNRFEVTIWDFWKVIIDQESYFTLFTEINLPTDTIDKIKTLPTSIDQNIAKKKPDTKSINTYRVQISHSLHKLILLSYMISVRFGREFVNIEDSILAFLEYPDSEHIFYKLKIDQRALENAINARIGGGMNLTEDTTTPVLNKFSTDLTAKARITPLHKAIGRDREIAQLIRVLSRESKSNAILVGEAGVGKTAIVETFAEMVVKNEIPTAFLDARVLSLNLSLLMSAAMNRQVIDDVLTTILDEVKLDPNIILFIDEIHLITQDSNQSETSIIANILKPALARGEIKTIGATTMSEYRKFIEPDGALARRFEVIKVEEPNVENSILICKEVRKRLENFHKLKINDEAIQNAVELSKRYITDKFLPDKAIDLLDEACAAEESGSSAKSDDKIITADDVRKILSEKTGIPIQKLSADEASKLMDLEGQLREHVKGQDLAVYKVAEVIRRSRAGLKDPKKPIGSFLFLGPSGVGKTELAKAITKIVYDTEKAMIRVDMSEFSESHTVQRLVGAPPGYVGYEEGGQLTNPVFERPYSLVLLDEIEKANAKVFDVFLQVLDDGRLTDGQGRTVDFKNTIIIATSNLASDIITQYFSQSMNQYQTASIEESEQMINNLYESYVLPVLKQSFRPEFINRFDNVVIFNGLTIDALKHIGQLKVKEIEDRLKDRNITINLKPQTLDALVAKSYSPQFGARPLVRALQEKVENFIAKGIIDASIKDGDRVEI